MKDFNANTAMKLLNVAGNKQVNANEVMNYINQAAKLKTYTGAGYSELFEIAADLAIGEEEYATLFKSAQGIQKDEEKS